MCASFICLRIYSFLTLLLFPVSFYLSHLPLDPLHPSPPHFLSLAPLISSSFFLTPLLFPASPLAPSLPSSSLLFRFLFLALLHLLLLFPASPLAPCLPSCSLLPLCLPSFHLSPPSSSFPSLSPTLSRSLFFAPPHLPHLRSLSLPFSLKM
ncbi:unnamed protein product [Acanthosepion pharaonis]|uniref:Uncharacterized protein n=1 Tax=Acanthosepion pharaonis TaxID=158019 RepID=A0A812D2J9_ACAPH|nr:unnamed protein product [Sepia pharaonis]